MKPERQRAMLTLIRLAAFADGQVSAAERCFPDELKARLALDAARAEAIEAELDNSILNYSLRNGALELPSQP